ncbi:MAG: hypothetical protein CM1200mP22_33500 [Dehalococcoidia bacterium]|nr:MAG: hypothetical protein CM1200mP22_33500 [Dehalococcoidia bacterium]
MRQFRAICEKVMPEFKQREEQRSVIKNSEDQLISEEVMLRKKQPKTVQEIPTIIKRDIRPWYSIWGFLWMRERGFPS